MQIPCIVNKGNWLNKTRRGGGVLRKLFATWRGFSEKVGGLQNFVYVKTNMLLCVLRKLFATWKGYSEKLGGI